MLAVGQPHCQAYPCVVSAWNAWPWTATHGAALCSLGSRGGATNNPRVALPQIINNKNTRKWAQKHAVILKVFEKYQHQQLDGFCCLKKIFPFAFASGKWRSLPPLRTARRKTRRRPTLKPVTLVFFVTPGFVTTTGYRGPAGMPTLVILFDVQYMSMPRAWHSCLPTETDKQKYWFLHTCCFYWKIDLPG